MKINQFIETLQEIPTVTFKQANGEFVPTHFHITEVGLVTKHFIDCGGVVRLEKKINFQLWVAGDVEHRLEPQKLISIIKKSASLYQNENLDVEIEYQSDSIGKYGVEFVDGHFQLTTTHTNCLAQDHCGIPSEKMKMNLNDLSKETSCCTPGGGCC